MGSGSALRRGKRFAAREAAFRIQYPCKYSSDWRRSVPDKKVSTKFAGVSKKPKTTKANLGEASNGFTKEEQAAMRERASELKAAARRGPRASKDDGEHDLLAKIAEMPEPDRGMATRLHSIIKRTAPALAPRTWYGMPAYAQDGNVICFFQSGQKSKTRYSTLGFSDKAKFDDGPMWPTAFALKEFTADVETRIANLLKTAMDETLSR